MRTATSTVARLGAALGVIVFVSTAPARVVGASQESLAGSWVVNPDESDDIREKIEAALQSERRERRGGSEEPEPDPNLLLSRIRAMESLLDSLSAAPDELTIEVTSGEVQVADADAGRVRIFYLDGQIHMRQTPSGSELETRAQWNGRELLVEQDAGDGDTVNEVYALGPDPSVLAVVFRLKLDRLEEPIVIRTVYDRSD
ncbi:MAG TPA: hypothetical protein VGC53_03045 [Vicinamibacteria bacterium]|jgi:hypothetical protein